LCFDWIGEKTAFNQRLQGRLLDHHQRPNRDLGEEFSSGVTGQPNTAVRRRVIRDHASVHAEIEAAQPIKYGMSTL